MRWVSNFIPFSLVLSAHVHDRGPERDGNPAGPAEKDRQVCQRTSEQAGKFLFLSLRAACEPVAMANRGFPVRRLLVRLHRRRRQKPRRSVRSRHPHQSPKLSLIPL